MDSRQRLEYSKETQLAYYVYSYLLVITYDYDKYYDELLKNALKYGMSISDFWNLDLRYYYIYEESYYDKIHEKAHIEGLYFYKALTSIVSAILPSKNKNKPVLYPEVSIYREMVEKRDSGLRNSLKHDNIPLTKENLQRKFMNSLANCY